MKYSFGIFCDTEEPFAEDDFDHYIGTRVEVKGIVGPPVMAFINRVEVHHLGIQATFIGQIPNDSELAQFLMTLDSAKLIT